MSIRGRPPEEGPLGWLIMLDLSRARAMTMLSFAKTLQVPHRTKTQSRLQPVTTAAQTIIPLQQHRQSQTTLAIPRHQYPQDQAGQQPRFNSAPKVR